MISGKLYPANTCEYTGSSGSSLKYYKDCDGVSSIISDNDDEEEEDETECIDNYKTLLKIQCLHCS